jgi:Zn-dependent M28 family amino/carboxypeptidase
VVVNSNSREGFDLQQETNSHFPAVPGWIHLDKARALFSAAGLDYEQMKKAALRRDFRPVPLHATLDLAVRNTWRDLPSRNVVGRIEGSDPKVKDQVVVFSAHWDHFGWDPALPGTKGDQIFHGAVDNASGVAALLELARAFQALPQPPRRTLLFMATTAEERGLLGAQYYAAHPLYPLRDTLADINIDTTNLWGRTRDLVVMGYGNSDLDDLLAKAAAGQGRVLVPDPNAERGFFYRADHFELAKAGVPTLYTGGGEDYIGKPKGYGRERLEEYVTQRYHKVADVVRPEWDPSGAMEDMQLWFEVGLAVAQGDRFPAWKPGSEFKAKRDASMAQVR